MWIYMKHNNFLKMLRLSKSRELMQVFCGTVSMDIECSSPFWMSQFHKRMVPDTQIPKQLLIYVRNFMSIIQFFCTFVYFLIWTLFYGIVLTRLTCHHEAMRLAGSLWSIKVLFILDQETPVKLVLVLTTVHDIEW